MVNRMSFTYIDVAIIGMGATEVISSFEKEAWLTDLVIEWQWIVSYSQHLTGIAT